MPCIEVGFSNNAHVASCALEPSGSSAQVDLVIGKGEQAGSDEHTDSLCLVDGDRVARFRNEVVLECDCGSAVRCGAQSVDDNQQFGDFLRR